MRWAALVGVVLLVVQGSMEVVPGERLGPLRLSDSPAKVRQSMGFAPSEIETRDWAEEGTRHTWVKITWKRVVREGELSREYETIAAFRDARAYYFWTEDPAFTLSQKPVIGASLSTIIETWGVPDMVAPRSPRTIAFIWDARGVAVLFSQDWETEKWGVSAAFVFPRGTWRQ